MEFSNSIDSKTCSFQTTLQMHGQRTPLIQGVIAGVAFALSIGVNSLAFAQESGKFKLEQFDGGVRLFLNGELFTEYLTSAPSPILWPLRAADGTKLTREYPMNAESANEEHDHPHHRSLWFTHGETNGIDFWANWRTNNKKEFTPRGGIVVHKEFTELEAAHQATISSINRWKKLEDDSAILTERRRMTFGSRDELRWIDFDIVLDAEFGDVHFGDTKEGSFAVRVAESMKVDKAKGGKIVNSEGQSNFLAWGKPAKWVNYTGPINDKTYGIAMFCHPSCFNFPNRWHVRTYGLFTANPFGNTAFTGSKEKGEGVVLKQSEELRLSYRVILHMGIIDPEMINALYDEFSKTERKPL